MSRALLSSGQEDLDSGTPVHRRNSRGWPWRVPEAVALAATQSPQHKLQANNKVTKLQVARIPVVKDSSCPVNDVDEPSLCGGGNGHKHTATHRWPCMSRTGSFFFFFLFSLSLFSPASSLAHEACRSFFLCRAPSLPPLPSPQAHPKRQQHPSHYEQHHRSKQVSSNTQTICSSTRIVKQASKQASK